AAAPVSAPVVIPDYLRPRSNFKRLIGYSAVAIVVIGWGILMIKDSPFNMRNRPGNGGNTGKENLVATGGDQTGIRDVVPEQTDPAIDETAGNADASPDAASNSPRVAARTRRPASIDLPAPTELDDEPAVGPKKSRVLGRPKGTPVNEPSVADRVEAANAADE